jgi:putative ABC transport system permease protein
MSELLTAAWQDLRYAVRVLRKSPGFALVAILSLALGIGANSAVFSLIYAVLLRPLPYPDAGRLLRVGHGGDYHAVTIPEYEFWKEHASSFVAAAGYRGGGDQNLAVGAHQEWITTLTVTADFLRTLGVVPALGREFDTGETHDGGPRAILLSDGLWRRALQSDPRALGRQITLDGTGYVVVGVLPAGFWFPQAADALVPLRPSGSLTDRGTNTQMIARLKPGVGLRQAEAEMPALTESLRRAFPGQYSDRYQGLTVASCRDWLVGDIRMNLLLLFGAVGLLLLIACSNLASLLLARFTIRQKELALRLALGSSRGRLLRQFLIENALLTMTGGVAGLILARILLDVLVALIPFDLPASAPARLDAPVLGFALAIAVVTGMAFSLVPILSAARLDLHETLKTGGRSGGTGSRQRTRSILVVSEVALSVTLLVSAGLLIQSLYRLHQERLGFTARGLTTFDTPFDREHRRNAGDQWRYVSTLLERFQTLHGVTAVAAINVLPLTGYGNLPTQREGHPENSIGGMEVRVITAGYFAVMGIPMRRGRVFLAGDTASSPPVILVNETLARRWWPGDANPLGDRVVIGRYKDKDFGTPTPREVVGIAADTKTASLTEEPSPTVYIPAAQMTDAMSGASWVLRTGASTGLAADVRRTIAEIDSRQRVSRIRSIEEVIAANTATSRFDAWLFAFLAVLALALTAIGIYGLLSFSVARRSHEIGTRMALGASRAAVLKLVLKQGIALIATGLIVGLAAAFAVTRWLATLLFGVRPTDPVSFIGVSTLLLGVGLLASYFPARRATLVDPGVALREE